ncbi:hypothetical protein SteCoe_13956 [Stentor coeruleus]|uniref:Uncharacterized protein n=1 Tax=Stentor coeruleus TaxID=5963 RepID=A0A1R2C736_9CILI|nr:hypothetical protein SteCoe_13956 [Stentor coeruleus]
MSIQDADVICFDADNTLIKYTCTEFPRLQYESLSKCLIKNGAPEELLTLVDAAHINSFGCSGLIADFNTGCLLKLDSNCHILCAYHGLDKVDNLETLYGNPPTYRLTDLDKYFIPGSRWAYHTHFAIGSSVVWQACVELMKRGRFNLNSYIELSEALKKAVFTNYIDEDRSGSEYYTEFYKNPHLYLTKVSEQFKERLQILRSKGKKLVVVTNSNHEYTNFLFEYCYGPEWHNLFDAYVFAAGKPEFFYHENEMEVVSNLNLDGDAYKKGSSKNLKDTLGGHKYVFIGDHYIGDVQGPKRALWTTVALIEEIYYEKSITSICNALDIENTPYNKPEGDILNYYPCWGSHFKTEETRTFWWDFVLNHADIVLSNISSVFDLLDS